MNGTSVPGTSPGNKFWAKAFVKVSLSSGVAIDIAKDSCSSLVANERFRSLAIEGIAILRTLTNFWSLCFVRSSAILFSFATSFS